MDARDVLHVAWQRVHALQGVTAFVLELRNMTT